MDVQKFVIKPPVCAALGKIKEVFCMKKLLAVALVLCLLVTCAVAEAPVDVKKLSDAELKSLYISVKEELMSRKLWEESTLPAGIYRVNKPLPEGAYECTMKDDGYIWIYRNYDEYANDGVCKLLYLKKGQMFTLSLYDDVVYILASDAIVRPFVGFDW
jgi:hypothetical protein